MENNPLSWQAPEFEHHEKEVLWSWISIILAVVLLAVALLAKNFLFAVFIVIAEILILIWGHRTPRDITFEITEKEMVIDGRERYDLKNLDHFGFVDMDEEAKYIELGLALHKFRPLTRILMPRELAKPVEQKLKLYGKKVDMEPTFVDIIQRLLRF